MVGMVGDLLGLVRCVDALVSSPHLAPAEVGPSYAEATGREGRCGGDAVVRQVARFGRSLACTAPRTVACRTLHL